MAKRKKQRQQESESPVLSNGVPVVSVKDRNTSLIQVYLRDAGAFLPCALDIAANNLIVGEVFRLTLKPVGDSGEIDPDGYRLEIDKDQLVEAPPLQGRDPRPEYSLEIDKRALHFWLRDHFGTFYDWSVKNNMTAAGRIHFKDLERSLFVKTMTRSAELHIKRRLPKLFHMALAQLATELEAFKPAMFFEGFSYMEEFLPKKTDLKNTQALYYDVFSEDITGSVRPESRRAQ